MVTRGEAISLTCRLISIPSINPGGNINEASRFISEWFRDNGIESQIVAVSGVANVMSGIGRKGGRRLLLNGKFDVVPPGDYKKWEMDPFMPVLRDGFIYGRGASDMKGGLAAMMLAYRELKKMEDQLMGEVVFMAVGDGETGGVNGTKTLLEKFGADYDGAIVPEPTNLCIESAQRGLRWIEIKIKGQACHAARPHVGKNAIEQAAKIILSLKQIEFTAENKLFEEHLQKPTISINKIHGGFQNNIIAEECKLLVDRRMLPGEKEADILEEIKRCVGGVLDKGFTAEFEVVSDGWDPFMLNQDEPILKIIEDSCRAVTGKEPVIRGKGGCTDASHIYKKGVPVVIIGPGNANESHTANEKVEAEKIVLTAQILIQSITQFLNSDRQ